MPRARNPYPGLLVVALVPAMVLGAIWKVADDRQPPPIKVTLDGSVLPQAPGVLNTPLLSVRRAPGVLSRDANQAALTTTIQPLLDVIDDTSCIDISIDGEPVAAVNEKVALRPASNVKLITAAVALDVLGADHVFTTMVQGNVGPGGVVSGNLYLVGGGDPVLGNWWWNGPNKLYPPFNMTLIEDLADSVVATGVTSIEGAVVGDATRYDDEWYPPTWTDDVKFSEGGPISGLLVNDSRETPSKSSDNPAIGAAAVFTTLLTDRHVTVGKVPKAGQSTSSSTIASVHSNPLSMIIAEMLTTSDNNTAEMLLKEIGIAAGGSGTRLGGLSVVNAKLKEWGIPMDGVVLVDGSGLSDDNRLTCAALLALLQRGSVDDAIGLGLAVGGKTGGTLYDSFVAGQPLSGIIRAKTGTLYNYQDGSGGKPGAKALSGYIPLEGGGAIEFSMLLNGPEIAEVKNYGPVWDQFAAIMAGYLAAPSPTDLAPK